MAKIVWALREDDLSVPIYGDETPNPKLWLFGMSETLTSDKFIET